MDLCLLTFPLMIRKQKTKTKKKSRKLDYIGKDTEGKLSNSFTFAVNLSAFSYSAVAE